MKAKFKNRFLNLSPQARKSSTPSLTISCLNLSAQNRTTRNNICINYWETSDLLQSYFTEDLMMAGITLTSILDVITRGQPSPCLKLKTVIASVATPKRSFVHLLMLQNIFLIPIQCYLTFQVPEISMENNKRMGYIAIKTRDLVLLELIHIMS